MFKKSKLFFWTIEILAVALLLYLLTQVSFIFRPVETLLSAVFLPLIIAGFLYYVFDPIIRFLERKLRMPRGIGIAVAVLLVIGAYAYIAAVIIPALVNQLTSLVNTTIQAYPDIQRWVQHVASSRQFHQISQRVNLQSMLSHLSSSYTDILRNLASGLTISVGSVIGFVVQLVFILVLVPIFLYYLLKDGEKLLPFVKRNLLHEDRLGVVELLGDMNATMSRYIFGLALDVAVVFVAVIIGYMVIGIPYPFLFAFFAAVTTLIPYLGPYIGVTPVVLSVAWTHPWSALAAVIYVLVVQQLDANLVYPRVVGGAVHVHPVTVMVLMLVMGDLYGLLGMVIAVPGYALVKEIVKFCIGLYQNAKARKIAKEQEQTLL